MRKLPDEMLLDLNLPLLRVQLVAHCQDHFSCYVGTPSDMSGIQYNLLVI